MYACVLTNASEGLREVYRHLSSTFLQLPWRTASHPEFALYLCEAEANCRYYATV